MPTASPQTVKLKSTLRLLIPRLRNAQKKDTALSVASRREMADLLSTNREQSARIRVENIIHTDITVELMEILELYAELLLARAGLLDVRDKNIKEGITDGTGDETGLEEAAASMIFCAPRLPRDVRELGVVRAMLIERFGKEFAVKANENADNIVPVRVTEKLRVEPPKHELVQAYLEEIARTYGVDWPRNRRDEDVAALRGEVDDEDADADEDSDGVGGGTMEPPILADGGSIPATNQTPPTPKTPDPKARAKTKLDLGNLRDATPPSSLEPGGAKSPVSVAPPGARTDNPSPKVRLPGGGQVGKKATTAKTTRNDGDAGSGGGGGGGGAKGSTAASARKDVVEGKVPTVDDLAKRFQALKR